MYRDIQPRKCSGAPPHSPDVSLRGPEGAVAISGRHLQFARATEKTHKPIASVAALPERHWQLQILKQFRRPCRFPDLSLRGPEGAVAISGRHLQFARATEKTHKPIASVAALTERHWQLQILKQFRRPCRFPDLSLRGPEGAVAISCRQLRFRRGFPVIQPGTARFPRRFAPRNDTSGGCSGAPEHLRG